MIKKRRPVQFNEDEVNLFFSLNISKPFSRFVKDAFYDKIDSLQSVKTSLGFDTSSSVALNVSSSGTGEDASNKPEALRAFKEGER